MKWLSEIKRPYNFVKLESQELHLFRFFSKALDTKIHQGWAFAQDNMGMNLIQATHGFC